MLALAFFECFDDFADVLGAIAGADEQGIGSIYNDEISYPNGGDELVRAPKKIAFRVK